jgi:hypothetical protein
LKDAIGRRVGSNKSKRGPLDKGDDEEEMIDQEVEVDIEEGRQEVEVDMDVDVDREVDINDEDDEDDDVYNNEEDDDASLRLLPCHAWMFVDPRDEEHDPAPDDDELMDAVAAVTELVGDGSRFTQGSSTSSSSGAPDGMGGRISTVSQRAMRTVANVVAGAWARLGGGRSTLTNEAEDQADAKVQANAYRRVKTKRSAARQQQGQRHVKRKRWCYLLHGMQFETRRNRTVVSGWVPENYRCVN